MSEVTTGIRRDELGNPIGANVTVKNDDWSWGGSARTDEGALWIQNSLLKGAANFTPDGIGVSLEGGTDDFKFNLGFDASGNPTGRATAEFGSSSMSVVPDGVTGRFESPFAQGTLTGTYTSATNNFALNFRQTGSSWGYNISTGYNSVGGFSFFGSIFNTGF